MVRLNVALGLVQKNPSLTSTENMRGTNGLLRRERDEAGGADVRQVLQNLNSTVEKVNNAGKPKCEPGINILILLFPRVLYPNSVLSAASPLIPLDSTIPFTRVCLLPAPPRTVQSHHTKGPQSLDKTSPSNTRAPTSAGEP